MTIARIHARIAWTAGTVVNLDSHGGFWGIETPAVAESYLAQDRADGYTIHEWNVTDRDGVPLRIVRVTDPGFVDGISVYVG